MGISTLLAIKKISDLKNSLAKHSAQMKKDFAEFDEKARTIGSGLDDLSAQSKERIREAKQMSKDLDSLNDRLEIALTLMREKGFDV